MTLKIVDIGKKSLMDIPGKLEEIVERIASGEIDYPHKAILLLEGEDGTLQVFGLGDTGDSNTAIGMLQRASVWLCNG